VNPGFTASIQFSGEEIAATKDNDILKTVISKLKKIRNANSNLQFIYIFQRGSGANLLKFAADADMLNTLEELDTNTNGEINEDEAPPIVGDPYDTNDLPKENAYEINAAFKYPTATRILGGDKWGTYMSGFAPILNEKNEAVGIIGLDMEVSDFNTRPVAH